MFSKRKSTLGPAIVTPGSSSVTKVKRTWGNHRGYLFARIDNGGESQSFEERWFVLHKDALFFFDSPEAEAGKPIDVIALRHAKVRQVGDDWIQRRIAYGYIPPEIANANTKSKLKGFEIVIQKGRSVDVVYELFCRSTTEAAQWVSRISEQIVISRDAQYFMIAEEVIADTEAVSVMNAHLERVQAGCPVVIDDLALLEGELDKGQAEEDAHNCTEAEPDTPCDSSPRRPPQFREVNKVEGIAIPGRCAQHMAVRQLVRPSPSSPAGSYDHTMSYAYNADFGSSMVSNATPNENGNPYTGSGKIIARTQSSPRLDSSAAGKSPASQLSGTPSSPSLAGIRNG